MAEPHLDHPGDVSWWPGHAPAPVVGECPHDGCEHMDTRTVAYGPDFDHYELHECIRCSCRGWHSEWTDDRGYRRYRHPARWMQAALPTHGREAAYAQ